MSWQRILWLSGLGCALYACGLGHNPDLPLSHSGSDNEGADSTGSTGIGATTGGIDLGGDGEASPDDTGCAASMAIGGAGGAGGAENADPRNENSNSDSSVFEDCER